MDRQLKRTFCVVLFEFTIAYFFVNLVVIGYWSAINRRTPFISVWSPEMDQPDNRRIYFHGARGRDAYALTRQSCAVESAARHNPNRSVQLFISTSEIGDVPLNYSTDPWLSALERYGNVAVILYDEAQYFAGTPLERAYHEGLWRKGPDHHVHMSDHLRIISSFRAGGLYMDVDFVTLKPLDERIFWNFFSVEDEMALNFCTCIFHLEHGHRIINDLMEQLAKVEYDPTRYLAYGPQFVRSFLNDFCGLKLPDLSSLQCPGDVKILPHHHFFPIPFWEWETYFEDINEDTAELIQDCHGLHVWNKLSRNQSSVMNPKALYNVVAARHCPLTYNASFN